MVGCRPHLDGVVRRAWDFPGSAMLICSSFVLRLAGGVLLLVYPPGTGLAAPVIAASPPLCCEQRALPTSSGELLPPCFGAVFVQLLPGRACSPSPACLGTERVLERAGPRGAREVFPHRLNIPFPKGEGAAGQVPSDSHRPGTGARMSPREPPRAVVPIRDALPWAPCAICQRSDASACLAGQIWWTWRGCRSRVTGRTWSRPLRSPSGWGSRGCWMPKVGGWRKWLVWGNADLFSRSCSSLPFCFPLIRRGRPLSGREIRDNLRVFNL